MQERTFAVGQERLVGTLWAPGGRPRAGLLLVHGFNSSQGEFGPLPAALAAGGFHVLAFDQRGYGRSAGEPGRTSVERAVEDVEAAAGVLREAVGPDAPLGIVGHSLGGAYALAALARTKLFRAGVVAHPVDRLFDELNPLEKAGYHAIGRFSEWRMRRGRPPGTIPYKNSYESLFEDAAAAKAARADGFLLGRVSLGNYRAALTMSASTWAKGVRQPVLVIASPTDRAVRPAHTRKVYDALAGPKELLLHKGGHSCFRDVDGPRLAQATLEWFRQHLGAPA
ncbi:MAG TPA: alpha/beta fold hydrolase [Candidatus Thermoplasmatota archaeon]|nr:alpha/beta fold hydrolase [Candidatus Thermoplasmatota archaeon]